MIFIDTASLSLGNGVKPVEVYVPLWFANGAMASMSTASFLLLSDGTSSGLMNPPGISRNQLFTLDQNFPSDTKFALEVTINVSPVGITTAQLYDITLGSVAGVPVATTSSIFTTLRTTPYTLTPGHTYGVVIQINSASNFANITDASLIIFP